MQDARHAKARVILCQRAHLPMIIQEPRMKLIGMLDSPYVRRVHITLALLGLPFEHEALSVFRHFDAFHRLNSIVKAPSFFTDHGVLLVDSTLIIDYAERLVRPDQRLMPDDPDARALALQVIGFALAAADKTAAIVYEQQLRPADKQHLPWLKRLQTQLLAAYAYLEPLAAASAWMSGDKMMQADLTLAVVWRFTQHMLPELVPAAQFPALGALSARAEQGDAFIGAPL